MLKARENLVRTFSANSHARSKFTGAILFLECDWPVGRTRFETPEPSAMILAHIGECGAQWQATTCISELWLNVNDQPCKLEGLGLPEVWD
jgi:hypothetical protein